MNNNWKKECNYRHKQDEYGNRINVIYVDGVEVAVSDEVYEVYASLGRKERYARERAAKRQLSLERMQEEGLPIKLLSLDLYAPSAEDEHMKRISEDEQRRHKAFLPKALMQLTSDEQTLVQFLFREGISPYALARIRGVSPQSIYKRQKYILAKLKKILEKLEKQG